MKKPAAEKIAAGPWEASSRGPLATFFTWLQAGRPNHHGILDASITPCFDVRQWEQNLPRAQGVMKNLALHPTLRGREANEGG
jgi:hypothetical protein